MEPYSSSQAQSISNPFRLLPSNHHNLSSITMRIEIKIAPLEKAITGCFCASIQHLRSFYEDIDHDMKITRWFYFHSWPERGGDDTLLANTASPPKSLKIYYLMLSNYKININILRFVILIYCFLYVNLAR